MAKKRNDIPPDVAARILFLHNRTCCVCRQRGKPVQIHHLDEDPAHHDLSNLCVLCFDCHHETQIKGGFDRKLDREQVLLYRDDWIRLVARQRAFEEARREQTRTPNPSVIELVTSVAEIYRERKQYQLLAIHYDVFGNFDLRDKYIDLALAGSPGDDEVVFLRGLQGRPELIPTHIIERKLKAHDKEGDWEQKGRFLSALGRHKEATIAYLRGILRSLEEDNLFSAAFYLKEVGAEGLQERLFELALRKATQEKELWWQVRALEELGWDTELKALLLNNAETVAKSGDLNLQLELAMAKGDDKEIVRLQKEIARTETWEPDDNDDEGPSEGA